MVIHLYFPGGSDDKESFSNEQYQRKQNQSDSKWHLLQSEGVKWNGKEITVMLQTLLQDLNQTLKHHIHGKAIY